MIILLEILSGILFITCLCLFGLHKINSEEIRDLKNDIRNINDELKRVNSKARVFELKLMRLSEASDKIEIVHKYDDSDAPDYPNSRRS